MCLVCGNANMKPSVFGGYAYSGARYGIVRCRTCGFMYLDPMPSPSVRDSIYENDDYFCEYYIPGSERLGYCEGNFEHNEHHSRALAALARFRATGRILDIGCAGGGFLIQARNAGYEVAGVEPNAGMAERAAAAANAPVIKGNFGPGMFADSSFDVVHLGDVLEHMPDPRESLSAISRLLSDNGLLMLEQPLTYNRSLFTTFLALAMVFTRSRYAANPPAHLWEFDPRTLRRFLENNGYSVLWSQVYENKAKPLFVYKTVSLKNRISRVIKNISACISNSRLFRWAELGDRMIVICRKVPQPGRPRVVFVHPNLKVGGAETNRLNVLKYMDRKKFDITVCCLVEKGKVADRIEALGFPVDCLHVSDRSYNIFTTIALYRYFRKNRFTIVHTCLSTTNLHGRIAARLAGVPIVIGEDQSEYERYNPMFGFAFRLLNRWLASMTDRIIVCSNKTGDVIAAEEGVARDTFLALHNVIDTNSFKPSRAADDVRREFGISPSDTVVVYVASLATRKGHAYLLEGFEQIARERAHLKLVLVGDGPLRAELREWSASHGLESRIVFTGQRMDIADILSIATVFVSPALNEAFGIVLIEAMFSGLPCVATRVGGVPEVVDDGITGILVAPADPRALADGIRTLLSDPDRARKLGAAGRQKVLAAFSADQYAAKLEALYRGLIAQKHVLIQ